jgi:hypothetical protein
MKKQLLMGSALLSIAAVNAQNGRVKPNPARSGAFYQTVKQTNVIENENFTPTLKATKQTEVIANTEAENNQAGRAPSASSISWSKIAGSMNIFGMLVSNSKPLQYNANVNAVSFIHRKSASYVASPTSNSGAIIAEISTNWGTTWDSTCIWSDGTNLARYPQGAIYSAPGNTAIANAYVVGSGPVTIGSGWVGNWYASKQLATYNSTASAVPNAMQFLSTVPSNTAVGKHEFSRLHFTSTGDGKVRSIAQLITDGAATTYAGQQRRGATLVKGSFNAGTFNWTSDSLIFPGAITGGTAAIVGKLMGATPMMAWNDAGTIGYAVLIGCRAGNTVTVNKGWQPMVFKTTNSGTSWSIISGIDFSCPVFAPVLKPLEHIYGSTVTTVAKIPNFNQGQGPNGDEGIDVTVDANNKLHIFATLYSAANDTITDAQITGGYTYDTENYAYGHAAGQQPYLYDFIGDGTNPWSYILVDSMTSSGPGSATTDNGYNENPWDADPANSSSKLAIGARLQMSRTPNGDHIVYTWSESDPALTNGGKFWNNIPNVKARCYDVTTNKLSTTKINVTRPGSNVPSAGTNNINVASRAFFHYTSPTSGAWSGAATGGTVNLPMTVSNSLPYSQLTSNTHWYTTAKLEFTNFTLAGGANSCSLSTVGLSKTNVLNSDVSIYPNPASNNVSVSLN